MKRVLLWLAALVLVFALAGGLLWSYLRHHHAEEKEQENAAPSERSFVKRTAEGEVTINLNAATQQRLGLAVETLTSTNVPAEIKAYGRILDPAPLAALVNEAAVTQAAAEASRQELERLKTLRDQNNASMRAFQAAEAAARRDQLAVRSAQDRLALGFGQPLAQDKNLPALVESLIALQSALVRVELPAGETLASAPQTARILALTAEDSPQEAQLLGPLPSVDPQTQGAAFLGLLRTNALHLAPGVAVTARLPLSQRTLSGVVVPRGAIVRFEGMPWAYAQTNDVFARCLLQLDYPLANGWLVTSGLPAGAKVVTTGAQQLLSIEVNTVPPGE